MKRTFMRTLPLLLCALMLLCSCTKKAPEMTYRDGVFSVNGLSVQYEAAPVYYEAKAYVQDRPIARLEQGEMDDLIFYEISGVAPEKMISSANYELFCAVGTELPKLWEMSATVAHICQTTGATYSLATVEGEKALASLIDPYQNAPAFPAKEIDVGLSKTKYDIKFESPLYPGIYYCLTYWQFEKDVLIYQVIENVNSFETLYADVEVTTEEYRYTENGEEKVEYYAVYNFGRYILHNRADGSCRAIGATIANALENSEK